MQISLLSGADKNAGDFLIVKRAHALLAHYVPNAEIRHYKRNYSLESYINEINQSDILVFAGGPGYVEDMYPGRFPLVDNLERIKPKMLSLGMGCYSRTSNVSPLNFNDSTKELIERLERDGYSLGCRDSLTAKILKASGVHSVVMTGCPAWYDLNYIECLDMVRPVSECDVRKIAVSDPAAVENYDIAKKLVLFLKKIFPQAQIEFIFHRGRSEKTYLNDAFALSQNNLSSWCEQNDVMTRNIEYSANGFQIYDECDFHIGFRVHAHIYSLSHRRPTFLIEEDGRGFGVNETLGLVHFSAIRSFVPHAFWVLNKRLFCLKPIAGNNWRQELVERTVSYALNEMRRGYPDLHRAFKRMKETYATMVSQLEKINSQI